MTITLDFVVPANILKPTNPFARLIPHYIEIQIAIHLYFWHLHLPPCLRRIHQSLDDNVRKQHFVRRDWRWFALTDGVRKGQVFGLEQLDILHPGRLGEGVREHAPLVAVNR